MAYGRGGPLATGPYMAELDITYQCNCRCRYNNTALIGYFGNMLEKTRIQLLWDLVRHNVACHAPPVFGSKSFKNR